MAPGHTCMGVATGCRPHSPGRGCGLHGLVSKASRLGDREDVADPHSSPSDGGSYSQGWPQAEPELCGWVEGLECSRIESKPTYVDRSLRGADG